MLCKKYMKKFKVIAVVEDIKTDSWIEIEKEYSGLTEDHVINQVLKEYRVKEIGGKYLITVKKGN